MIEEGHVYDQDLLRSQHNHEFINDPAFQAAYARGLLATGMDYQWHWRVHTGLWAAHCAHRLQGDFVECGVAKGFLSSAIMTYLNWDSTGRIFYLLDTFSGLDEKYVSPVELRNGALEKNKHCIDIGLYPTSADNVIENFSEWKNAKVVVGPVPETLDQIHSTRIAYLHLDMNCAPPEIAAIEHLWSRLVPGAIILLDDYAYFGYRQQKLAMDAFAETKQVKFLSLPTGQGLMVRPPHSSLGLPTFSPKLIRDALASLGRRAPLNAGIRVRRYPSTASAAGAGAEMPIAEELRASSYLARNPDVAAAGIDPWQHYLKHGMAEGRVWACAYETMTDSTRAAVLEDADYQLALGSGLFNREWYLSKNPDVSEAGIDPLVHYLKLGAFEGRCPNPQFDGDWYLKHYPDVSSSGINPLIHYLKYGIVEGRSPNPLQAEPDPVQTDPVNADRDIPERDTLRSAYLVLARHLRYGLLEGRSSNPMQTDRAILQRDTLRATYLNLLQLGLTGIIYADPSLMPGPGFGSFDKKRREEGLDWPSRAESMVGLRRLRNIRNCIEIIAREGVPGDFLEAGVWRGGAAIFMRAILDACEIPERVIWLADSFQGLPPPHPDLYPQDLGLDLSGYKELAVSLGEVKENFERYGLLDERVKFLEGWFEDTLPLLDPQQRFSLIRLDGDLYESTIVALENLYPKLTPGGSY
jgi:hypothetical protein